MPKDKSGLTIGRGYDCSQRETTEIVKDLIAAGVPGEVANVLARAAKLQGLDARRFIIKNDLLHWQISGEAQLKLFERIYPVYEQTAKRVYTNYAKGQKDAYTNWNDLKQALRDIVTDLAYRGDYHKDTRDFVFYAVHQNNMQIALAGFSNLAIWRGVPEDHINGRIHFLKQG